MYVAISLYNRAYPEHTVRPFLKTPSGVTSTFLPAKNESASYEIFSHTHKNII